jgi:hypothetical protein
VSIDWSLFAFPKNKPAVVERAVKQKADKAAWRKASKAVDKRDKDDEGSPRCFITGKRLQVTNTLDEWTFRDRAHIEARSKSKARRNEAANVLSVSRGVHRLIDSSALFLLTERLKPATSITAIKVVAWNRRMVAKKEEPCKIRKGLAVVELDDVTD